MAHVPSTLPRGSGERENAIFQVVGAIVGSSRPAPESGKRSPLRSSPGKCHVLLLDQAIAGRGLYETGKRSSPDGGDSPHRYNAGRAGTGRDRSCAGEKVQQTRGFARG